MAEDHDSRPPHEPQLTPVGEKSLPAKCKANILTYCPTMDLIALSSEDDELFVYRLNGQKVLGGNFKGDPYLDEDDGGGEIRGLKWKNTGHLLSVACADNTIRVISAYSGKTVHHYAAYQSDGESSPPVKVTCLGWGVNFTDSKAAKRHLHDAAGQVNVEDLLSPDNHPSKAAALLKADLPRELALLDVESSLPKLSTLPATGSDDDVFSSRASIDAIFHAISKSASDAVDVLLVGFDDGTVHLRIFDCFEIGSLQVGGSIGNSGPCQILRHASHPLSSTHALLALAPEATSSPLHLLTLDLRFITRSGRYLSLLAHKTTQLQNLLRYISQVQRQIELEWKNAQELPTRYMRSVNEDLQEKCHCDFVTAAYHLVVTGDCFEPLREFLVDIVGERGHKRWEKAVSSGYENVRRLTHECLLPALERCEVLLSRLIGLSKFYKLSEVLGLETSDLTAIVETLDCLHLLAHHILIHANEELTQFSCFSRWLRHEIDMQSAEPMSQTLEELMEKTDMVEYPQTLKYIRGALTKSKLRNFIQQLPMMGMPRPPTTSSDKWAPTGQDRSFYDTFRKLLEQSESPEEANSVELPKMNDLTKRLGLQFERVFGQIALTQRRGILHRSPLALHPDCDKDVIDIAMCNEDTEKKDQCVIYIATRSIKKKHLLCFYRVELDSENGVSSTRRISTGALDLQEGEVRQVQFVEDGTVVVLWSNNKGTSYLLSLPFQPATTMKTNTVAESLAPCPVDYHDSLQEPTSPDPVTSATVVDLMSPDSSFAGLIKHTFIGAKAKAKPIRVDVNGRRGRRAICVLYGDAMRYEVLDLDAELEDEEEEEDEEDMEELEE
ncbi:anaphase-promoting complex component Cut20/Apc4 [Aspergillus costaricaensis CBS 115574]|uniref:Anaphase-promoting complex component Cut20/Apc4 n=1 Tax=Aspergillus costaricaensis CBS 115574 TaxID=1448317 RepID=A0ACD1ICC0_9EURO|nr:anaphase-promoting complex component Cut20/Apc4 [Aspergillus costaricaensis CBS 115574]RAK87373.1 anaphase-promoting complex component Cut20/Apc4 [Aspergillus costaricaensis CBS 115574]